MTENPPFYPIPHQMVLEGLQARLLVFYLLNWGLTSFGVSNLVAALVSGVATLGLMRLMLIQRPMLYVLGALVWALVTVALQVSEIKAWGPGDYIRMGNFESK